TLPQLIDNARQVEWLQLGKIFGKVGHQPADDFKIGLDGCLDPRALDFDGHDFIGTAQHGPVDLPDGTARHRFTLEILKMFFDRSPQFSFQYGPDPDEWKRA